MLPEGLAGVDCSLEDGQTITWRSWTIQAISCPGHALAHLAFTARKGTDGPLSLFCGGALASLPEGKREGQDVGPLHHRLGPLDRQGPDSRGQSLRNLADLKTDRFFPRTGRSSARKPSVDRRPAQDRRGRRGDRLSSKASSASPKNGSATPRSIAFLAKDQAMSNGSKPWTQVSEHLFLTGNTYVLTSKDNPCLLVDPWEKRSAEQFAKLQGTTSSARWKW